MRTEFMDWDLDVQKACDTELSHAPPTVIEEALQ